MIIELPIIIILSIIILIIGILGNIAGFGGGILVIPILTILFNFPISIVIGTTLSALFFPALIGSFKAWQRNEIDFKIALIFETPTIVGVFIGESLTERVDDVYLELIFGIIALLVSIFMLRRIYIQSKEAETPVPSKFWKRISSVPPMIGIENESYSYKLSLPFTIVMGFIVGILAGLLGIGGGWLKAPILVIGFGLPPIIASGTALFMITITASVGGLLHFLSSNWDLTIFLLLSINLSVGSIIGDKLKSKMNGDQVALIISIVLGIISVLELIYAYSDLTG